MDKSGTMSMTSPSSKSASATAVAAILSPTIATTFVLIFGGCCSNVYTLEAILSFSPATGHLVTFLQFILTAVFKLPSQLRTFDKLSNSKSASSSETLGLKQRKIPLKKWIMFSVFFVTINVLNNAAFNYKISLPLHIILRSAGPVTSMLLGYVIAGKRYSPRKTLAVVLLFVGVVLAALSDASSRAQEPMKFSSTKSGGVPMKSALREQMPGFVLVTAALVLSAFMGIYSDNLYSMYGRSQEIVDEQLFYSHTLSLPIFALQHRTLKGQYITLMANASAVSVTNASAISYLDNVVHVLPLSALKILLSTTTVPLLLLGANAVTQILCITGVHRLSTQTSSLTVSIVLNIRKLVSLLLSIWLFGNRIPTGVAIGAAVVFLGGGLYSMPERKKGSRCVKSKEQEGKKEGNPSKAKADARNSQGGVGHSSGRMNGFAEEQPDAVAKRK